MANKKATQTKKPTKGRNAKGQFDFGNEGRGKKWESPTDLSNYINEYIDRCDSNTREEIVFGKKQDVSTPIPYTIEGLAVHLGISRQTLKNYEIRKGYEPYFAVIREYRDIVCQNLAERALMGDSNTTMTIFLAKNHFGYVDKQEIENTGDTIIITRPQKPNK